MEVSILKNTRYFRYTGESDDDLEIVTVLKYQNISTVKCSVSYKGNVEKKKISIDELKSNYTKLEYDGVISLSIAHLGKLDDVMITFCRRGDLEQGNCIPYAICRQCITDIFHYAFTKTDKDCFGLSINVDSCPANVKYINFLACNSLDNSVSIAYYIGDKLNTLIDMVDTTPYDEVLYKLFADHCSYISKGIKFIKQSYLEINTVDGYVKSLRSLLDYNNFYNDICTGFNIYPLKFDMSHSEETKVLDPDIKQELSFLLSKNINNTLVLKYDKDIDLDELQHRLYVLISDINDDIYFVAYDYIGEYHVPVEAVETEDNINTLHSIVPNAKSIDKAYQYFKLNTDKYN